MLNLIAVHISMQQSSKVAESIKQTFPAAASFTTMSEKQGIDGRELIREARIWERNICVTEFCSPQV